MFGDFIRRLTAPDPAPLADADARLALAALLVRVARTDGHYDAAEAAEILKVLKARYALSDAQAATLRQDAEVLEAEAPDTVRFTRAIKDAVPIEARKDVIESLWEIALADGKRDHHEDTQLRLVARLLGVNDGDSARARQRVQARQ